MTLKIGDLVRLKSGSPAMTVVAIGSRGDEDRVTVVWCYEGEMNHASLPPGAVCMNLEPPPPNFRRPAEYKSYPNGGEF